MAKNIRRMFAMVLVMCMIVSALPVQALATTETTTDSITEGGVTTDITTTTTTTTDSNGNTTVTVEIQKDTSGTNSAGATVSGSGSSSSTTTSATIPGEEGEDSVEVVLKSEGSSQSTTTTTSSSSSTTTDGAGNKVETKTETTITESSNKESSVEGEFGSSSTTTTTTTTTTITGADGSTSEKTVTEGSSYEERTEEVQPGDNVPTVEAEANRGESNSASGSITETKTEGKKPTAGDKNYDYTETTITTDRTVTTTVSNGAINEMETKLETSIQSEEYGKYYGQAESPKDPQAMGLGKGTGSAGASPDTKEGYELFLSGTGDYTNAAVPVFVRISKIFNEETGEYEEVKEYLDPKDVNPTKDNKVGDTGMVYGPSQLVLTHENGEKFYAYCADYLVEAPQEGGHWYKIENLEDSGHYTAEDAAMLRAIALNGYWGTSPYEFVYETDENGNVKVDDNGDPIPVKDANNNPVVKTDESGNPVVKTDENGNYVTGSLLHVKALLEKEYADVLSEAATDADGNLLTVKDADGKETNITIGELIAGLQEHEALACTQAAIWAYSVNRINAQNGDSYVTVEGVLSAIKAYNDGGGRLQQWAPAKDLADRVGSSGFSKADLSDEEIARRVAQAHIDDARLKLLFDCLMNLDATDYNKSEDITTIINEHSIENVAVVVKDKVDDGTSTDAIGAEIETDKYNTDLKFTLAFVPNEESDSLLVYVCDTNGNKLIQNGKEVCYSLVGDHFDAAGSKYDTISLGADGYYTIPNLTLSENVSFDLRLQGTQYLENGVYLYTAEGGRTASQTLVGIAEGELNVTAGVTISFNVDEEKNVVAQRVWYSDPEAEEKTPTPPTPPTPEPRTWNPPQINRLANDDVVINEEPVPLATPARTGDSTGLWVALFLTVAFAMVAVNLFDKKRQHEAF